MDHGQGWTHTKHKAKPQIMTAETTPDNAVRKGQPTDRRNGKLLCD
jgi:hypothetical protein